jgi:hypothetical protein
MLEEVAIAEKFAIQHYLETGEITIQMPTQKPRQDYKPLSQVRIASKVECAA